jgi:hypothetical protein
VGRLTTELRGQLIDINVQVAKLSIKNFSTRSHLQDIQAVERPTVSLPPAPSWKDPFSVVHDWAKLEAHLQNLEDKSAKEIEQFAPLSV